MLVNKFITAIKDFVKDYWFTLVVLFLSILFTYLTFEYNSYVALICFNFCFGALSGSLLRIFLS